MYVARPIVTSFTIPEKSWWDNYYSLIEVKLPFLNAKHASEPDAIHYLGDEETKIKMYRKYFDYFGYVFYVLQKI